MGGEDPYLTQLLVPISSSWHMSSIGWVSFGLEFGSPLLSYNVRFSVESKSEASH